MADCETAVKTLETNESYALTVTSPSIQIESENAFGAIYALESLSQLVDDNLAINGTVITDHPRFAFRATMIDTSRHFYPLVALKARPSYGSLLPYKACVAI